MTTTTLPSKLKSTPEFDTKAKPLEKRISEVLSSLHFPLSDNSRANWTRKMKELMMVAIRGCESPNACFAASSVDNAHCGEWLYDFVCYENSQEENDEVQNSYSSLLNVLLVAECEWRGNDYPYQLRFDFEKLMLARCPYRIMIFEGLSETEVERHLDMMKKMIPKCNLTSAGDRYMFAGWVDTKGFYFDCYVHEEAKEKNDFDLGVFDKSLESLHSNLYNWARNLEFEPRYVFDLSNYNDMIPFDELKYKGVYFFEISSGSKHQNFEDWLADFEPRWADPQYSGQYVSNLRKKRTNQHIGKELPDWIPMYIGKSQHMGARIFEHIEKKMGQRTFALKLKARENMANEKFRLSYIKIPSSNYDWVVTLVERTLRDKYNPIIGRQ